MRCSKILLFGMSCTLLSCAVFSPARPAASASSSAEHSSRPGIKDLLSAGPAATHKDKLMLFGQFVGDWKIDNKFFDSKGRMIEDSPGRIHFGWILYGTAIQDVWEGASDHPKDFGTTVRVYDPKNDVWQCIFFDPPNGFVVRVLGRKVGNDIVLETKTLKEGYPERWIFSEITPQSFHWHDEESHDGGKTWIRTEDVHAQRITS